MEQCKNCCRVIGNLETPHIWNGHIVCRECRDRLENGLPRAVPQSVPRAVNNADIHRMAANTSGSPWVAGMGFLAMAAGGALMLYSRVVPTSLLVQTQADQLALVCLGGGLGVYLVGRAL